MFNGEAFDLLEWKIFSFKATLYVGLIGIEGAFFVLGEEGGGGCVFVWRIFYGVENLETSIVAGFFKVVKYIMLEYCIEIYV